MLPLPHCNCSGVQCPPGTSSSDPPFPFAQKSVLTRVTRRDALFDKNQGTCVTGPTAGALAFATRFFDQAESEQQSGNAENQNGNPGQSEDAALKSAMFPSGSTATRAKIQSFVAAVVTPKSATIMLRSCTEIFRRLFGYLKQSLQDLRPDADRDVVAGTLLEALSHVYVYDDLKHAFLDGFRLASPDCKTSDPAVNDWITALISETAVLSQEATARATAPPGSNSFSQDIDLAKHVANSAEAYAVLIEALPKPHFQKALKLENRLIYEIVPNAQSIRNSSNFAAFVECFKGCCATVLNAGNPRQIDLSEFLGDFTSHPATMRSDKPNPSAVLFVTLAFAAQGESFPGVNLRLMLNSGVKPSHFKQANREQPSTVRQRTSTVNVITPLLTQRLYSGVADQASLSEMIVAIECEHSSCTPDLINPEKRTREALYDWLLSSANYTENSEPGALLAHVSGSNIPEKMRHHSTPDTQNSAAPGHSDYVRSTVRVGTAPDGTGTQKTNQRLLDTEYLLMGLACELSLYIKQQYSLTSLPTLDIAMLSAYAPCLSCNRGMLMALFDNEKFPNLNKLSYWACEQLIPKQIFPPETGLVARPESSRAALTQPD